MRTAITFSELHDQHAQAGHVERPERLHAIKKLLMGDDILKQVEIIKATQATVEDVILVHPRNYYDRVEAAVMAGGARLDPDTYATPGSLAVALEGLGGLLQITEAVLNDKADNGFAIVRPPGHHARPDEAMGFCLFANIAIAAEKARQQDGIDNILIMDFDVHHGNGTQEIFYDDPNVIYMSTHQWPLYPGTGALEETGAGDAKGTTINIPLPAGTGDEDYLTVFQKILTPIALDFNPDLIFISAGYDAHWMDPIAGMNLSATGFAAIVKEILLWAKQCTNNKVVALLEGGYHADALAHAVLTTTRLFVDPKAKPSDPFGKSDKPDEDVKFYLEKLIQFHGTG